MVLCGEEAQNYYSHIVTIDQGTSCSILLQANFPPKCSPFYPSSFDDAQTNNDSVCEKKH